MKKLKTIGATLVATFFLITGGAAFATSASAYTEGSCFYTFVPQGKVEMCYRNYDWWEETFQGKRDGWVTYSLNSAYMY
jgi:hypothetical protein